jgi:uncharacterized protein
MKNMSQHKENMEIFAIPVQDKYIIYRPLRKLAFIGNRAMVDLAHQFASLPVGVQPEGNAQALDFLNSIGFSEPDMPSPAPVNLGGAFKPTSAALLMTGRCNLRCIYCYASGGEKESMDLPLHVATAVIDQVCRNAQELGKPFFEVTFHGGGEPSLAWDTVKAAAAYARSRELPAKLNMVSNGVWNRERCEWVAANLDGLTISMDGRQPTQDAQRPFPGGKGSFEAVMQTIRYLDQNNFKYGIRITSTPEYFSDLPGDVAFFCHETGCRNIQIEPCFESRRGAHQLPTQAQAEAFAQSFLAAYDIAKETGHFIYYSGARPWLLTGTFCSAPFGSSLTINPRGEIVACYEITDRSHPLAQKSTFGLYDEQANTLTVDIDQRKSFLTYLNDRRSVCRDCFCLWHCAGDCYTRALEIESEDGNMEYARCIVNRLITSGLLLRAIAASDGVYHGNLKDTFSF